MSDLSRLKAEYERRDTQPSPYQMTDMAYLFTLQARERALLSFLKQHEIRLEGQRILEMGCGTGGVLHQFQNYQAAELHGVDILPQRLAQAQSRLPQIPLLCADGQALPYASNSFDIVMQFTAFSSLLDSALKTRIAQEMLRLCRPHGTILWYDFWLNPTNPQTKGIRPNEIRQLFPNCQIHFKRITLAPPIARRIVPFSWILALLLEKMSLFNSHYFAIIRKGAA